MNVKKTIKKQKPKAPTKKLIYVKPPKQLFDRGTKDWLLTNVPKTVKYSTQLRQFHENNKLGKYVHLMENLKALSLDELKQMLIKNNQRTGGTKADLAKKIYSRITNGVPQCPNCGEKDLDIFCTQNLYHCGECRKVIQQRNNSEWIY